MHFPISGVESPIWLPPLVALAISFFTSMGGVSGAFLLLPFQVSVLGYTTPSVSGTNHVYNIVAIPSGIYRYLRERRLIWPLTFVVILGTLPGVVFGVWIRIVYLPDPRHFKFFVGLVLLYIGFRLVLDIMQKDRIAGVERPDDNRNELNEVSNIRFNLFRSSYTYQGREYAFSPAFVMVLCLIVGVVGGIYGIGGGAIVAPFFVTILKLPVYTVAGAALMGTFVTSLVGVACFQCFALFEGYPDVRPDWLLGFLFGVGGFFGTYLGARCQRYVPARAIKCMLGACVLFVAVRYVGGFFF